ncbi:ABC transporter ATP-binding protein [Galactobacter valiniphilus]|uniref:ABC transporter ATP-binding protein n=1 Tax=Galactobacter valiniphilus TaxID=2676122 RepID=UPI0037365BF7
MTAVLAFDDVSVIRGARHLLKNVSWSVGEDERWIVMGANGAGKSTLLRIASTRLFPTRGAVGVLGERMGKVDLSELRPAIGVSSALLGREMREEETALNAVVSASYGMTGRWREHYDADDERRALQLLNQWGASTLLSRRYSTLSEGERARVLIARSLMSDPELLLLDEPAAGLDLAGREDLVRRLGAFAASPLAPAMVLVTHHLEEIPEHFTHALLLRDGEVVAQGPLEETVTQGNLEATFGLQLTLNRQGSRFSAFAR